MKSFELSKLTIERLDHLMEDLLKSYSLPELQIADNIEVTGCHGNCSGHCSNSCGGCTGSCSGGVSCGITF